MLAGVISLSSPHELFADRASPASTLLFELIVVIQFVGAAGLLAFDLYPCCRRHRILAPGGPLISRSRLWPGRPARAHRCGGAPDEKAGNQWSRRCTGKISSMASDELAVTSCYLDHLTDGDLAVLCGPYHESGDNVDYRSLVRARRGGIEGLLNSRGVFEALFVPDRGPGPLMQVSPFLAFAVAVEQAGQQLSAASYVPEWAGVGRRTPLFDVPRLRDFMSSPWRRFFLAELLASYTRVASGSVVVATRRGLRRQRFSELDPVRLAGLLDVVPDAERPGVLRRLGDLALFLTGVFPDYVARHGFGPVDQSRLLRSSRVSAGARAEFPWRGSARGRATRRLAGARRRCRFAQPIGPALVPGCVPAAPGPCPGQRRRHKRDARAL